MAFFDWAPEARFRQPMFRVARHDKPAERIRSEEGTWSEQRRIQQIKIGFEPSGLKGVEPGAGDRPFYRP